MVINKLDYVGIISIDKSLDRNFAIHCYHLPSLSTVSLWAQKLPFHKILSSTLVCRSDLMALDRLQDLFAHRFLHVLCFSFISVYFSYSYVTQTKLASSQVNFCAHDKIQIERLIELHFLWMKEAWNNPVLCAAGGRRRHESDILRIESVRSSGDPARTHLRPDESGRVGARRHHVHFYHGKDAIRRDQGLLSLAVIQNTATAYSLIFYQFMFASLGYTCVCRSYFCFNFDRTSDCLKKIIELEHLNGRVLWN